MNNVNCNVCNNPFTEPLFKSSKPVSMTTMNTMIDGETLIYFCQSCSHLQTKELPNLETYYAKEYEININSEEDDQIYDIVDSKPIFRYDHQANTLLKKLNPPNNTTILDYGCAKGTTLRKIAEKNKNIKAMLYDVTDKYIPYWEKFPCNTTWSVKSINPSWYNNIDIVLSFYALEHISDLDKSINDVKNLLKKNGVFYFIIPNVYENVADFIVADHINHFSRESLKYLLAKHGFVDIDVDDNSHRAAYVVHAKYIAEPHEYQVSKEEKESYYQQAKNMANSWVEIHDKINQFKEETKDINTAAIYGAGFYGNFISFILGDISNIQCFIDQNPHLEGRMMHGKPIIKPASAPVDISHVIVGLNPLIAKKSIASIEEWKNHNITFYYL